MAPPPEEEKGGGCCARWLRREVLLALALGQLVSLLITSTGFSSSELARRGTAPSPVCCDRCVLCSAIFAPLPSEFVVFGSTTLKSAPHKK